MATPVGDYVPSNLATGKGQVADQIENFVSGAFIGKSKPIAYWSLFANKITLDTSTASVKDTLAEFVKEMEPYFTVADRLRTIQRRPPSAD